ncbi:MAG TPA: sn-glycerol-3-phosphate ABC transporter ATP-binding protein UgpC [Gaiellaceae bacterium]|nr:sn-glycerol-3-phosphate ABC transporter ATP-binding protein UgpC [Gaiellaceae bacterium]HEU5263772.1 sn-glycerol-3-phosphate ABC transporter ATP-binding protein UgpC [Gaiellaceae bacterium]
MAEIVLESLTKVYSDGTRAVTDLDLGVRTGEFVVFVGPSGCGKTTALRMIAGLESITSGEVKIDGHVVNDLPPKDRDIAMVFQNYALYPHMNAAKNMGFALKMRGLPRDEIDRRVREAARILGLTDSLQKKPRTLSGGQRQRVAMGRAIVRNPQAFLMDEPLSNLDAKLRVEMRAEISRIQRDLGVTTVYVTHDQIEAMTMGDRVAVMRNGLLQQVDTPQVLYKQPRNLFVAEFIGSPAMNLVLADLARHDGSLWAEFGEHRLRLADTTVTRHPGLARFDGRSVVLGIRPEDIEDASLLRAASADRRLSVVCDIREDMGSEVYVHFNIAAQPVATKEVLEAHVVDAPEDAETRIAAEQARGSGVQFVARLDRATRAREREKLELAVDVDRVHFFDPETGLGVDAE